jgi:hypothetical protein
MTRNSSERTGEARNAFRVVSKGAAAKRCAQRCGGAEGERFSEKQKIRGAEVRAWESRGAEEQKSR